jgi:hypothetical protein
MTIIIDTTSYDVPIVSLDETCEFLDKYAERTEDGILHRELIGCYFNQQIKFGSPVNATQKAAMVTLWAKLTEAEEFHTVTVPDVDGVDFTFTAYFSQVKRGLRRWNSSETYWKEMTVNFIAQSPAKVPS